MNAPETNRHGLGHIALWVALAALLAHAGLLVGGVWTFDALNYDDPQVLDAVEHSSVGDILTGLTYYAYKPVYFLSLKIDALFGSGTVAVAHVVNLLLHALAAFLLVRLLFSLLHSRWIAGAAGLLFAIHPVHVENVAWLSERKDVLSLVFVLAAHLLYRKRRAEGRSLSLGPAALLLLGGLAKGTVWSYVGVILVDELLYRRRQREGGATETPGLLMRFVPLLLVANGGVALDVMVASASGAAGIEHGVSTASLAAAMGGVHVSYLQHLLVPVNLALDYAVDPAGSWAGLLPILGALLALGAVAALWFGLRRSRPLLALAGAFWIFGLAPVNNIWPRTAALMADRYLYIPAIGVYLLLALLIARAGRWRGTVLTVAALLLLVLCELRTHAFATSDLVWTATIEKVPTSALARIQRGHAAATQGYYGRALEDADVAIELEPRPELEVRALLLRCAALYGLGRTDDLLTAANLAANQAEALTHDSMVRDDPRAMRAQGEIFRGQALEGLGERRGAVEAYRRAVELDDKNWSAWFNFGTLRAASRNEEFLEESVEALQVARRLAPGRLEITLQLATVYGRRGDKSRALAVLKQAEERHGKQPDLLHARANILLEVGNEWQKARDILRELREVDPHHPKGKRLESNISLAIGRAALRKGRAEHDRKLLRSAGEHFNEALRILPENWQAHVFAGDAMAEQGNYRDARKRYREARQIAPKEKWIAGLLARTAALEAARAAEHAETRLGVERAARIMAGAVRLEVRRIDLGFSPLEAELPLLREVADVLEKGQMPEADHAAALLVASALLVTGDELSALSDLQQVYGHMGGSERSPALLDAALTLRAMLYERQTEFMKAKADYELLRKRRPDDPLPRLRLLQIQLRVAAVHLTTAKGFSEEPQRLADAHQEVKDMAAAVQAFADAEPGSSNAGLLAVQADINLENWIEALRRLNAMEIRFPENPSVQRGFNAVYVAWYTATRDRRHLDQASRALRRAIDLDPRDARTSMDSCQLARVAGDLNSALKHARRARAMESYSGGPASRMLSDLHIRIGYQKLDGGEVGEVKKAVEAARRVDPKRAGSYVLEGELILKSPRRDRFQRAYALAQKAKELEPYDPDVNSLLAKCHKGNATTALFQMARYRVPRAGTKGFEAFEKLSEEARTERLANLEKMRDRYRQQAIRDLNMALILDPEVEDARELRSQVRRLEEASPSNRFERIQKAQASLEAGRKHEDAKEYVAALYAYMKAVELNPRLARAHFYVLRMGAHLLTIMPADTEEGRQTAFKYHELSYQALIALETLDVDRRFAELWFYRGVLNDWDAAHKPEGAEEAREVALSAAVKAYEHYVLLQRAAAKGPGSSINMRRALKRLKALKKE